ncbi:hypothetical protein EVAR_18075_1 [Eumeta japonica]|uniref:Uncharacterized protein n=1 Tax=Eumeta variegata TaxID=151549 RepID=A0A4C1VGY7_EUMVA|nr:hypothetical protein EVAR_18075_1 [Eumeta japonica]
MAAATVQWPRPRQSHGPDRFHFQKYAVKRQYFVTKLRLDEAPDGVFNADLIQIPLQNIFILQAPAHANEPWRINNVLLVNVTMESFRSGAGLCEPHQRLANELHRGNNEHSNSKNQVSSASWVRIRYLVKEMWLMKGKEEMGG